jgi:hypothetical protein
MILDNTLITYRFRQFPLDETLFHSNFDGHYNLYWKSRDTRCSNPATNQNTEQMANGGLEAINLRNES